MNAEASRRRLFISDRFIDERPFQVFSALFQVLLILYSCPDRQYFGKESH
jgi:hypothetical protein